MTCCHTQGCVVLVARGKAKAARRVSSSGKQGGGRKTALGDVR
jgi:hypothetical protein